MEQKDIDIYEILKDEEYGTELYTPICGKVWHSGMANDKDSAKAIWTEDKDGREHFFDKNGKIDKEGEVLLFPSNEMRDWSKFFKKGDVLVHRDDDIHVIFEGFKDNRYTRFKSKHYLWKECFEDYSKEQSEMITFTFRKASDDEAKTYINTLEKFLGGKLNRETLEIEKPEFKDGDIVMSDSGTIVLVRGISLTRKIYYHAYMCNEYIYINQVEGEFFSRISRIKRFATDSEKQQLFDALAKEGKRWDSEKKQIVDLKPAFEIGKLYVFNDEDEDGKVAVIGKVIGKNESDGTLTFGEQYDIENEHFVTNETFYLNISLHKELREATELEAELFAKHRSIRLKEEKEAREQPDFKTFDKVLVRCGEKFKWLPAFFIRDRGEDFAARYNVLPLHSGKPADFTSCITYEGHENIAFTDYDIEKLPF